MKRICVYCGSSSGARPEYLETATRLGRHLAEKGIGVVYGGAEVGLMGALAASALNQGGEVIGVIPEAFADKVKHHQLTELHIVPTMHDRKQKMFDLSEGFIVLPGRMGTIEEAFEILTWSQLGFHEKPCGILNVCGYFDGILDFLNHSVNQRFVNQAHRDMVIVDDSPEGLLERFKEYQAPKIPKWVDSELMVPQKVRTIPDTTGLDAELSSSLSKGWRP